MNDKVTEAPFKFKGGLAPEEFTCTSCQQKRAAGADWMTVHMFDGFWGPFCLACWHKVPEIFERIAQHPGIEVNVEAIRQKIAKAYLEAKVSGN